jgi:hypothetical protein
MTIQVENVAGTGKVPLAITVSSGLLRIARLRDEWYEDVPDPEAAIAAMDGGGVKADVFTFIQRLPCLTPKFKYHLEWDNIAAIPITTYDAWWTSQISKSTRNHIRKAAKSGVVVRVASFDDDFVRGISDIYNETPVRQGRPFKHYGKDFETLRAAHATFLERSEFVGAYAGGELIGFVKLVYSGGSARTMQVISKLAHRNKCPTNALLAKAVEICAEKGVPHLVYGKFDYGNKGSEGLAEFKSENGFVRIAVPRYYAGLTSKGRWCIRWGLHRGWASFMPRSLINAMWRMRSRWYTRLSRG